MATLSLIEPYDAGRRRGFSKNTWYESYAECYEETYYGKLVKKLLICNDRNIPTWIEEKYFKYELEKEWLFY